jgi:hypothetical protein
VAEPLDAGAVQAHVVGGPAGTELLAAGAWARRTWAARAPAREC